MGVLDFLRPRYTVERTVYINGESVKGMSASRLYETQPALRSVISFLADNVAGLPLKCYVRQPDGGRERDRDSILAKTLQNPNEWSTGHELIRATVSEYLLHEDSLWLTVPGQDKWTIAVIPHDWTTPKTRDGLEVDYIKIRSTYMSGEAQLKPEDFIRFMGWSPYGSASSSSRIEALKQILSEQISAWNFRNGVWKNGGRVTQWISRPADTPWGEGARDRFAESWKIKMIEPILEAEPEDPEHSLNLTPVEDEYYVPDRFQDLVYLTQMAQGDIMRRAVEAHRRDRGLCGGTLVWQLNDCWPVASWSGRDWYGTWKPLHYFLREAYRDVLPSVSLLDGEMSFWVVSDRPSALKGTLEVSVERFDGSPLWRESLPVSQAAGSSVCWLRMEQARVLGSVPASQAYVRTVFTDASGVRYRSIRLLSSVKEAQLPRPKFAIQATPSGNGFDVTVSADVFAKGVFLNVSGAMLRLDASGKPLPGTCTALNFSDNYFDLTAGESRTVHVSSPLPPDEFRSRLVVTSI